MTIICGYKSPCGQVWIGADRGIFGGDFIFPEKYSKIVRHGRWALAVAGSAATPSLIRRKGVSIAEMTDPGDIADLLQTLYRDADYKKSDTEGPPRYEQEVVLASAKGVWSISDGGIVGEPSWGFVAAGSGMSVAYGAAFVATREGFDPEAVVRMAIEAACALGVRCGGEAEIIRME